MADVRITHHPHLGAIHVLLTSPDGGVGRDMFRRGHRVRNAAVRQVGVKTGRLRAGIHVTVIERNGMVGARVGNRENYALPHHEGHRVIYPRRGSFLIFDVGGRVVFARRVRAVGGNPYLRDSLGAARD